MGLGQLIGQPLLAPTWLLLPQRDHLLLYRRRRPVRVPWGVAGTPFQPGVTLSTRKRGFH
jgi:hypothetical protein